MGPSSEAFSTYKGPRFTKQSFIFMCYCFPIFYPLLPFSGYSKDLKFPFVLNYFPGTPSFQVLLHTTQVSQCMFFCITFFLSCVSSGSLCSIYITHHSRIWIYLFFRGMLNARILSTGEFLELILS